MTTECERLPDSSTPFSSPGNCGGVENNQKAHDRLKDVSANHTPQVRVLSSKPKPKIIYKVGADGTVTTGLRDADSSTVSVTKSLPISPDFDDDTSGMSREEAIRRYNETRADTPEKHLDDNDILASNPDGSIAGVVRRPGGQPFDFGTSVGRGVGGSSTSASSAAPAHDPLLAGTVPPETSDRPRLLTDVEKVAGEITAFENTYLIPPGQTHVYIGGVDQKNHQVQFTQSADEPLQNLSKNIQKFVSHDSSKKEETPSSSPEKKVEKEASNHYSHHFTTDISPSESQGIEYEMPAQEYLAKERLFLNEWGNFEKDESGKITGFSANGKKAFRTLLSYPHRYIPGAFFDRDGGGSADSLPTDSNDQQKYFEAQEKNVIRNINTHHEIQKHAQTIGEVGGTIVQATRVDARGSGPSNNTAKPLNGGELNISFDTRVGYVSSEDGIVSLDQYRQQDYRNRKNGYPKLTVFSHEKNEYGMPRFAGTVVHPDDPKFQEIETSLGRGGALVGLYQTEMDIRGNGNKEKVYIQLPGGRAFSLGMGDVPISPGQVVDLVQPSLPASSPLN